MVIVNLNFNLKQPPIYNMYSNSVTACDYPVRRPVGNFEFRLAQHSLMFLSTKCLSLRGTENGTVETASLLMILTATQGKVSYPGYDIYLVRCVAIPLSC